MKRVASKRTKSNDVAAVVCLLGSLVAANHARAAIACSVGDLEGLNVHGVSVVSAVTVAASGSTPSYCDVIGQLNTAGLSAPLNSAGFELRLPSNWNKKFLFLGVGGFGGLAYADASANPLDQQLALVKGYAVAVTDTGHVSSPLDAHFALLQPGKPDEGKLADYFFRAAHEVTVAAKQLTRRYFGKAIEQAYFDGCSNGGRMALIEATRFPEDYDGIVAGAPFFTRAFLNVTHVLKQELSPESYIPATLLPTIDAAINASCDKADGVNDSLIQNPGACHFSPYSLVCGTGNATGSCLTRPQADTLNQYFTAVRDPRGGLVYPGYTISNLATSATGPLTGGGIDVWRTGLVPPSNFKSPEPWGNIQGSPAPLAYIFGDQFFRYVITLDPKFNYQDFPVTKDGSVGFDTLRLFDARTAAGDVSDPTSYQSFLQRGKLILFHGFSDPALPAFETIRLYKQLAEQQGGYQRLDDHARLFMVPGMTHCLGGPGPNVFDTLTPLESWVEKNAAPDSILASHYINDDPSQPVDRTMPLCPFPTQATYNGSGAVNAANSWSCTSNRKLLNTGPNGQQAGVDG